MEVASFEMEKSIHELSKERFPYAELVSAKMWDRLTDRLTEEEGMSQELAERALNQTLCFLKASADNPGVALAPSEAVDAGWHTFILFTQDYAEFCEDTAGRFIHHEPTDIKNDEVTDGLNVEQSYKFLADRGYEVDAELWLHSTFDGEPMAQSCGTPPTGPPRPAPPPAPGCHTNCSVR